jgi:hypothetical protein
MNDRGSNRTVIALLREAQLQLMLINRETPSVIFRRAIDTLEAAIKQLQR